MWHLPATTVAGRGLAWPDAGGRWLPVWLPQFVTSANLQQACAPALRRATAPRPRHGPIGCWPGSKPACRRLPRRQIWCGHLPEPLPCSGAGLPDPVVSMSLMSELPAGDTHDVIHRGNEVVAVVVPI